MLISSKSVFKTLAAAFLCLALAACQTTGLKPGSLTTNYAPKGWVSKKSGNTTVYACHPSVCKSPQLLAVGPLKVRGDVETAIRSGLLSKELMNALDNVVNVASRGSVKLKTDRKIVTKTYSGFDVSARFKTASGTLYLAGRIIVQHDRGSMIVSFAKSRATAKSNLNRFLKRTTIRRQP